MCVIQGSRVEPRTGVVNTAIKNIAPHNVLLKSRYHSGVLFDMLHATAVLSCDLYI